MAVSKHVSWGLVKQCKTEVRAISTTNDLKLAKPLEMAQLKFKACRTAAAPLRNMCVPDAHPRHILMQLRGGSQRGGQREKRGGLSGKAATTPTAAGGKKDVEEA
jgi:hypothetical protein